MGTTSVYGPARPVNIKLCVDVEYIEFCNRLGIHRKVESYDTLSDETLR